MTEGSDSTFTVRRGSAEDAEEISSIAQATFPLACPPGTPEADIKAHSEHVLGLKQVTKDLNTDGVVFYVAEDGDDVAGYAMLVKADLPPLATMDNRNPVELRRIYVVEERHGTGVARALIDSCFHHARTHGYDVMWAGTNTRNAKAKAFYSKSGFEDVGERTFKLGQTFENDRVYARAVWEPAEAEADPDGA